MTKPTKSTKTTKPEPVKVQPKPDLLSLLYDERMYLSYLRSDGRPDDDGDVMACLAQIAMLEKQVEESGKE